MTVYYDTANALRATISDEHTPLPLLLPGVGIGGIFTLLTALALHGMLKGRKPGTDR